MPSYEKVAAPTYSGLSGCPFDDQTFVYRFVLESFVMLTSLVC
jgi:hypothetical protein